MGTAKSKSGKKAKSEKDLGFWLSIIGNILIFATILAYFTVLPLYMKNWYEMVATNKYKCLMMISKYVAISLGAFTLVYFALWGMTGDEIKKYFPLWKVDVSVLAFLLFVSISYFTSPYKVMGEKTDYWFYEGALWGKSGWFMGYMTYLIFILLYFVISRFFTYTEIVWIPIILVAVAIFALGGFNRYGLYFESVPTKAPEFISTLGNINWFAGFQSVVTPVIMGLFWAADRAVKKYAYGVALIIGYMMVLLNGSDSAVMCTVITLVALFIISSTDEVRMKSFFESASLFFASGIIIYLIDIEFPKAKTTQSGLAHIFDAGPLSFFMLLACIALSVYFSLCKAKRCVYPEGLKKRVGKITLFVILGAFLLYVLLIIINTLTNGSLPVIGRNAAFIFNPEWGSDRGATWISGIYTFAGLPFGKKLIGAGPDCFYFALCNVEKANDFATVFFEGQRLTNAHNEILTLLVNIGVLGTAAFLAICYFLAKKSLSGIKKSPALVIFPLIIISYLSHNMFSFEQVTNTPLFLLTFGICGAAIVRNEASNA